MAAQRIASDKPANGRAFGVKLNPVRPKTNRALASKPKDLLGLSQEYLYRYEQYGWDVSLSTAQDKRTLLMSFSDEGEARTHFDALRKQDYLPFSHLAFRKSTSRKPRWIVEVAP